MELVRGKNVAFAMDKPVKSYASVAAKDHGDELQVYGYHLQRDGNPARHPFNTQEKRTAHKYRLADVLRDRDVVVYATLHDGDHMTVHNLWDRRHQQWLHMKHVVQFCKHHHLPLARIVHVEKPGDVGKDLKAYRKSLYRLFDKAGVSVYGRSLDERDLVVHHWTDGV